MDSTRRTKVIFDVFGKSVFTTARMLNVCAINSDDECWKYLSLDLSNVVLLG